MDSTTTSASARFTWEGWSRAGFFGFRPLLSLDTERVPPGRGVYAVLRESTDPPTFLATSRGGRHKGKDPSVDVAELQANWVEGAETVDIGKAANLRRRLAQYRDFGRGHPIGHAGGRYLWQLADAAELVVCWSLTHEEPREVEKALIADFVTAFGSRPFATLAD